MSAASGGISSNGSPKKKMKRSSDPTSDWSSMIVSRRAASVKAEKFLSGVVQRVVSEPAVKTFTNAQQLSERQDFVESPTMRSGDTVCIFSREQYARMLRAQIARTFATEEWQQYQRERAASRAAGGGRGNSKGGAGAKRKSTSGNNNNSSSSSSSAAAGDLSGDITAEQVAAEPAAVTEAPATTPQRPTMRAKTTSTQATKSAALRASPRTASK